MQDASSPTGRPAGQHGGRFDAHHLRDLAGVQQGVQALAAEAGLGESDRFALRLVLEEALVNVYTHGYGGGDGPVAVTLDIGPQQAVLRLRDQAPCFDPATVPAPLLQGRWEDQPLGGLGWHLIRQLVDRMEHRPAPGGGNLLTLVRSHGGSRRTTEDAVSLAFEQRGAVSVVSVAGSVDSLTAESLGSAMQQHVGRGHVHLVGDFSGVGYVSSAGLRAFLLVVRQARSAGGDLRLTQVQPAVLKVLDLTGFTTILKLYPSVQEAIASYG